MLRDPTHVGAVAPSGRALAHSMCQGLGPKTGQVIEIGAGTGAITKEILKTISPDKLSLLEMNSAFCDGLRLAFPGVRVENLKAQEMKQLSLDNVGAVLSGLPLLNMPQNVQFDIVSSVFNTLRPGGVFVQFTYGPRPPIVEPVRRALGLTWIKGKKIWPNLPPARVYVFSQGKCAVR